MKGEKNKAAMGKEWGNKVNERFRLSRDRESNHLFKESKHRKLQVAKSARIPRRSIGLRIDDRGIFGQKEESNEDDKVSHL